VVTQIAVSSTITAARSPVSAVVYSPAGFIGHLWRSIAIHLPAFGRHRGSLGRVISLRAPTGAPTMAATGDLLIVRTTAAAIDLMCPRKTRSSRRPTAVSSPARSRFVRTRFRRTQVLHFTAGPGSLATSRCSTRQRRETTRDFSRIPTFRLHCHRSRQFELDAEPGNQSARHDRKGGSQTGNSVTRTVSITLAEGENVTCTSHPDHLQPAIATTASSATYGRWLDQ